MTGGNDLPKVPKVPKQSFLNRNLVAIVMLPSIIGIHYGWSYLQRNEALVPEGEVHGQPILDIGKRLWDKIQSKNEDSSK